MGKGPGLYTDIGKKARDLLYKDYQTDQSFALTTSSPTGVAITSAGTKKGDLFLADFNTLLKKRNVTTDIKVDIYSNYLHVYAGISSSIGLTENLIVNFSGMVGSNVLALGTDLSINTKTGNFIKYNAGLSFSSADLIASLALNENGGSINASYYHIVNPLANTAVGAEVTHSFSTSENTITIGTHHALDPLTIVKAQVNNAGNASALIQHEWPPRSLFTVSGEVDTKSIDKSPKVGLALALKALSFHKLFILEEYGKA